MLYSGEQILSFKSCLVFYAGDSLNFYKNKSLVGNLYRYEYEKKGSHISQNTTCMLKLSFTLNFVKTEEQIIKDESVHFLHISVKSEYIVYSLTTCPL